MACGMDFPKPRLGESTALSILCLCYYPPEVSHCSRSLEYGGVPYLYS